MQKLYFIAIVIPEPVQTEITKFKLDTQRLFSSSKALNLPAHITLVAPFKATHTEENFIKQSLNKAAGNINSFYLQIDGFDKFGTHTIFLKTDTPTELLKIHTQLNEVFSKYQDDTRRKTKIFSPHITVAYKDIKADIFPKIWQYFNSKQYFRITKIDNITLFRHDGKKWHVIHTKKLQK